MMVIHNNFLIVDVIKDNVWKGVGMNMIPFDYTPQQEVAQVQIQIYEKMVIDVAGGIESDIVRNEENQREGQQSSDCPVGGDGKK